jgi:hypothetical protein
MGSMENDKPAKDMSFVELSFALRCLTQANPRVEEIAEEAAARIDRLNRLQRLLGQLAPSGTAPRTALEEIYKQSADSADRSQIVNDLGEMLEQHWGEWTPALRKAEGFPDSE